MGLKLSIIDIAQLPLYNQDNDQNPPAAWTAFRGRIKSADSVLFVTPKHNRSVPAALKNAIDIGSRPYGQSAWGGKPGEVVTASPRAIAGFGANHYLRQSLVFLNVHIFILAHRIMRRNALICEGRDTRALCVRDAGSKLKAVLVPHFFRAACI